MARDLRPPRAPRRDPSAGVEKPVFSLGAGEEAVRHEGGSRPEGKSLEPRANERRVSMRMRMGAAVVGIAVLALAAKMAG